MPIAAQDRVALPPAIWAGVIASVVFQGLEIILIPLVGGGSPWGPTRMIAAMVLGRSVLPPPDTFSFGLAVVALVVDILLAIIYSLALAWLTHGWSLAKAVIVAVGFGIALYYVNFYGLIALFPWFEMGRNGVTLFTHIVFSVVAVLAYFGLRPRFHPPLAT